MAATGPPHLRLETISGRNGPCPVPQKSPPESSVPGDNLDRGSRRNQLRRGHGSPPVLSEVPHELSTDAHSKECKRSPQQFIPAGFPLHDQPPTGTEDSASPPHHTGHGPFRTRPPNLSILIVPQLQVSLKRLQIVDINVAEASDFPRFIQFLICKAFPSAFLHPGPERVKFAEGNIIHLIF